LKSRDRAVLIALDLALSVIFLDETLDINLLLGGSLLVAVL
jgi:hypothetical protein